MNSLRKVQRAAAIEHEVLRRRIDLLRRRGAVGGIAHRQHELVADDAHGRSAPREWSAAAEWPSASSNRSLRSTVMPWAWTDPSSIRDSGRGASSGPGRRRRECAPASPLKLNPAVGRERHRRGHVERNAHALVQTCRSAERRRAISRSRGSTAARRDTRRRTGSERREIGPAHARLRRAPRQSRSSLGSSKSMMPPLPCICPHESPNAEHDAVGDVKVDVAHRDLRRSRRSR